MKVSKRRTELREKLDAELRFEIIELEKQLFELRFKGHAEGVKSPSRIGQLRRDIARVKTVLHERKLGLRGAAART